MPVGILQLNLYLPMAHSLKDKRHYLRPILHDLRSKFSVSVAETGKNDVWQSSKILIAIASNSSVEIEKVTDRILKFIENHWVEVYLSSSELEIIIE